MNSFWQVQDGGKIKQWEVGGSKLESETFLHTTLTLAPWMDEEIKQMTHMYDINV